MTEALTDESTASKDAENQINPEVLQNISVTLSIEVGRAMIKIKDLMRLTQGSVVELDRIAGEPLDLLLAQHRQEPGAALLQRGAGALRSSEQEQSADFKMDILRQNGRRLTWIHKDSN